jgi:glycosyltransferase involved in cell wall biosynthesis
MIEVLHFIDTYRISGPGKTIINSARYIDRTRYRIHTASFGHPDPTRNEFAAAAQKAGLPSLTLPETHRFNPEHIPMLRSYTRDRGIDIVHAHGYRADVLAYIATRGLRRVRLVTTHHGWIRNSRKQRVLARMAILLSTRFDGVEVVSTGLLDELPRSLRTSSRVAVVRNAIVLEDYRRQGTRDIVRRRLGLSNNETLLAAVGRLSAEKGCLDLIEALRMVVDRLPTAHLVLVGEGPLEAEIRRHVERLELTDNVHFAGFQRDVRPFYEASDIVISPSHTEGLSNIVLEAMTMSLPVVATAVGGTPEIIDSEESGVLVRPQSPAELADAIVRVAQDQSLREKIVAGGLERVRARFSFQARMAAEQEFYVRVLATQGFPDKTAKPRWIV